MHDCDHADTQYKYTRLISVKGAVHYSVFCPSCDDLVRTTKHGGRLLIKHSEIPAGFPIHDYVGGES